MDKMWLKKLGGKVFKKVTKKIGKIVEIWVKL